MSFHQHFLPGDIQQAGKELDCLIYMLAETLDKTLEGEFEIARDRYNEALRSLEELTKMAQLKEENDQLKKLLQHTGLKIARVYIHEKL